MKSFTLLCLMFTIMCFLGCPGTDRVDHQSPVTLAGPVQESVYAFHLRVSVQERGAFTNIELDTFLNRLLHDTGLDIRKIPFMASDLTDSIPAVKGSSGILFNAIGEVVYFTPDEGPGEPVSYWECLAECYEACIAECERNELYPECCGLCWRQCQIECSSRFPGGWSRRRM